MDHQQDNNVLSKIIPLYGQIRRSCAMFILGMMNLLNAMCLILFSLKLK